MNFKAAPLVGRILLAAIALAVFSVATALIFHGAIGDQNQFIHLNMRNRHVIQQ